MLGMMVRDSTMMGRILLLVILLLRPQIWRSTSRRPATTLHIGKSVPIASGRGVGATVSIAVTPINPNRMTQRGIEFFKEFQSKSPGLIAKTSSLHLPMTHPEDSVGLLQSAAPRPGRDGTPGPHPTACPA
jgi:hypothetical protein